MRFFITCDANWDARIDKVISTINKTGYEVLFEKRDYGKSLEGVAVILMCRDPSLNFKQRIRYSKKEKDIYIDIMLDFFQFVRIEQVEREKIVAEKLIAEIPPIIAKYKLENFNLTKFKADLVKCFKKML
jgi:hypothetical protein